MERWWPHGHESLTAAVATLGRELFQIPFSPDTRLYWPCLLSSGLIAWIVSRRRGRAGSMRSSAALAAGPARLWLHPSALCDYKLLLVGALVRPLLLAPWAISAWGLAVWVSLQLDSALGIPQGTSWSPLWVSLTYTAVLFAGWDFSRYLLHRLMHQVPALWELHKVHHSAQVLTPFTFHRVHPLERALYLLRGTLVTGLITGVFFHCFRTAAVQYQLLGVNVLGFLFNLAGANLRHSHIWLSYGSGLERWLLSPAQHQLHHALWPRPMAPGPAGSPPRNAHQHGTSNYGTWLALWDRLGGSLELAGHRRNLRFGLPRLERNHSPASAVSALFDPIRALFGVRPTR